MFFFTSQWLFYLLIFIYYKNSIGTKAYVAKCKSLFLPCPRTIHLSPWGHTCYVYPSIGIFGFYKHTQTFFFCPYCSPWKLIPYLLFRLCSFRLLCVVEIVPYLCIQTCYILSINCLVSHSFNDSPTGGLLLRLLLFSCYTKTVAMGNLIHT